MRLRTIAFSLLLGAVVGLLPGLGVRQASADHGGLLEVGYVDVPSIVDAVVSSGEYADSMTDGPTGMRLSVQYSGNVLGMAVESTGRGWIAISLGAVLVGSNYTDVITFALDNGTLRSLDQVDHGWERHIDVQIGGTDDIIAAAGIPTAGGILMEFQIPLDSADDNDHHFLPNGTYPFSLAYNATSTDFGSDHTAHSSNLLLHVGPTPQFVNARPTLLQASASRLVAGQRGILAGVLRDGGGTAVANHPVEFYLNTTYGLLYLGLAPTNALGKAAIEYEPRAPGTWTVNLVFRGSGLYLPSNRTVEIVVDPPGAEGVPWVLTDTAIAFVVMAVVGGVWGAYVFVAFQLSGIRREARREVTSLSSQEGQRGENHPRDD